MSGFQGNIAIDFDAEMYDGDWSIHCIVSYPMIRTTTIPVIGSRQEKRETLDVDYAERFYNDTPEQLLERVAKDIASYILDPVDWIETALQYTRFTARRLEHTRYQVAQHQERITSLQSSLSYEQQQLENRKREIAALEAEIAQETGGDEQ